MNGFDAVASPTRDFTASALALIESDLFFQAMRNPGRFALPRDPA